MFKWKHTFWCYMKADCVLCLLNYLPQMSKTFTGNLKSNRNPFKSLSDYLAFCEGNYISQKKILQDLGNWKLFLNHLKSILVLFWNAIRNLHQYVAVEKRECFVLLLIVLFKSLDFRKGGLKLGFIVKNRLIK